MTYLTAAALWAAVVWWALYLVLEEAHQSQR
jgi:hypothetical protein